ncbi:MULTISPECIES: hypothetical protein [unclassified Caballeronia]|uniref:hypothetical protein n=1 Tax=unclassified Caballeronia TaxID=2646786 RepID=UPI002028D9A2|nr:MULTISPECIES: hypothetical protein [unclassified Caballeronia]MDR5766580.1 hypothetical protein [Caballeronia sp. LZ028]
MRGYFDDVKRLFQKNNRVISGGKFEAEQRRVSPASVHVRSHAHEELTRHNNAAMALGGN